MSLKEPWDYNTDSESEHANCEDEELAKYFIGIVKANKEPFWSYLQKRKEMQRAKTSSKFVSTKRALKELSLAKTRLKDILQTTQQEDWGCTSSDSEEPKEPQDYRQSYEEYRT